MPAGVELGKKWYNEDFAGLPSAEEGSPSGKRFLLGSSCVGHHHYLALHATLCGLVLDGRRAMTEGEVALLYSSMDHLLRGGADWATISLMATATKAFYQALKSVKWPLSADASTYLLEIVQPRSDELFQGAFEGKGRSSYELPPR